MVESLVVAVVVEQNGRRETGSYGTGVNQENLVNSVAVQYCAAKGAIRAFTASPN